MLNAEGLFLINLVGIYLKKSGLRCIEKEKPGEIMDLFIMGIAALLAAVIGAVVAVVTRQPKLKILTYAFIGLILGIPIGYVLAPVFLSFY